MHPNIYPSDRSGVSLVGKLLMRTALAWFAPLLEKKSQVLENLKTFIVEFHTSFSDTDSVRTTINKIRRLCYCSIWAIQLQMYVFGWNYHEY
jgi:hypothetical protein